MVGRTKYTYVAGIESSTLFGARIYGEALGRGLEQAQRLIALINGATYNKGRRRKTLEQIRHFEKNTPLMRYADFCRQGLFIGSGVIEAG